MFRGGGREGGRVGESRVFTELEKKAGGKQKKRVEKYTKRGRKNTESVRCRSTCLGAAGNSGQSDY